VERVTRHIHRGRAGIKGRYSSVCFLLMIFAVFLLVSCSGPQVQKSPAKGVYHVVKKGETAYRIARAYSISLKDLAEANNISDVSSIKEDSVIFIPDADQVIDDVMAQAGKSDADAKRDTGTKNKKVPGRKKPSKTDDVTQLPERTPPEKPVPAAPAGVGDAVAPSPSTAEKNGSEIEDKPSTDEKKAEVQREKGRFVWPVKGTVKTRFGIQPNKSYHNNSWIKIACPAGTQVKAAASGTVIYSTNLKSFGETIIIRHTNDFATVYTHLKKRYVKQDQNVKKGDTIALVGEIDEMGDVYINFEIRLKGKARDPLLYLP
jgi:lipoprotein NlpD